MAVIARCWRLYVILLLLSLCGNSHAMESSETLFSAATRAFKKDDYELALQLFLLAEQRGMNDARLHYNVGVTRFKMQQYEQAYRALELAAQDPEFSPLAHINMGLAAVKMSHLNLARRQFRLAQASANTSEEKQLTEQMLQEVENARRSFPAGGFTGSVRTEIGRNDNVILENANYTIQSNKNDAKNYVILETELMKPLTDQITLSSSYHSQYYDQGKHDTTGSTQNQTSGANSDNNDFSKVDFKLDYTTLYDAWAIRSGFALESNTYRRKRFQNISTFNFSIDRNPYYDAILGVDFRYARIQHFHIEDASVSGTMLQLEGRFGAREAERSIQYVIGLEDNNRDDSYNTEGNREADYSPTRLKIGARSTLLWFDNATIDLFLQYQISEHKNYDIVNTDELTRQDEDRIKRKDDRLTFQMELLYPISKQFWLSAKYRHLNNDSNIITYTYTSNNASMGLVWQPR